MLSNTDSLTDITTEPKMNRVDKNAEVGQIWYSIMPESTYDSASYEVIKRM